MKISMKYGWYLILWITLASFSTTASAMMALSGTGERPATVHNAKKAKKDTAKFIAWKGNRLSTSAGTFIINPSVQVIDKAGSRKMKGNFRGSAPTVKLFFKDRRLVKVLIR